MDKNFANSNLMQLADEIKKRPILTQYLKPAGKSGYVCICGNGAGEDGTGAKIGDDGTRLICGKCSKGYSNIDIIAKYLGVGTTGKDFIEVVKHGCQLFGLPFADDKTAEPAIEKVEKFDRLAEAQNNLAKFVENQGGKWRGLTLETLKHIKAGYLKDIYFTAAGKVLPAVVIPNDLGGVYFRSLEGKYHRNNKPMAVTTVFMPDADSFDLIITEGQINALSIFQAVPNPSFGIMACSGTSGEKLILANLQQLKNEGKKFRVVLAFDKDSNEAGQNAAKKLVESLTVEGYTVCSIDITGVTDMDLNDVLVQGDQELLKKLMDNALALARDEFDKISATKKDVLLGDSMADYFDKHIDIDVAENKKFKDRKTGFENLDEKLTFFLPGIYVVSGLPALGKTTFALQLLQQISANTDNTYSIFCSYEMSAKFLYAKILAREVARLETNDFKTEISESDVYNRLTATKIFMGETDSHEEKYKEALVNLKKNRNFYIWEEQKIDVDALLKRLKEICAMLDKPPVVCIDYLQLLGAGSDNPKSAIDDALRKFFNFRRETNTTFILISSLNRANYNTDANLASLKESGGIEYSADAIFFLQYLLETRTAADAEKEMKEIPRKIQLKCLKYRFGSQFDIGFNYYPNFDTFEPMDEYTYFSHLEHIAETQAENKTTPKSQVPKTQVALDDVC